MNRVISVGLLGTFSLLMAGLLYWPGVNGTFKFDDIAALTPLNTTRDIGSALEYIFGGTAGPLGRPIALVTFLLQREHWPSSVEPFIAANIAIHLLNGALLMVISAQLMRWRYPEARLVNTAAVFAGSFWLLMPIHAATVLIVVQRMALLSASFVLGGVALYITGRRRIANGERHGYLMMTAAVVIFTTLAVLSKENGALLPTLLLILEMTVLGDRQPPSTRFFLWWQGIFLLLPTAAVFGYLLFHTPAFSDTYALRPFTFYERTTTQAYALLEYLKLILLPQPLAISPYYDDLQPIGQTHHSWLGPILLGLWLVLSATALWLRTRAPWLSLVLLWFIAGHLLESTTLPLEQFFLHRNYIPTMAIAISSGAFALSFSKLEAKSVVAICILLLITHAGSLYATVAIWKEPRLAAELWVLERRSSIRASEALEDYYRTEQDSVTADKLVRERFALNSNNAGAAIDWLASHCKERDEIVAQGATEELILILPNIYISNATFKKLDHLFSRISENACPAISYESIENILDALGSNPYVARSALHQHNLLLIRFRKHFVDRNFYEAVTALERAYALTGDLSTLRLLCETLFSGGLQAQAFEFVQQARAPATHDPRIIWTWERRISVLREKYGKVD